MRRNGFTLLEFLVVLIVFGGLAAIIIPVFNRAPFQARRAACQSNLKRIALGFQLYKRDSDSKFPPIAVARSGHWAGAIQRYDKSWQLFQCPMGHLNQDKTTDYFYNARLAQVESAKIVSQSQSLLLGDGPDNAATSSHLSELPLDWRSDLKSPARRHLDGAN